MRIYIRTQRYVFIYINHSSEHVRAFDLFYTYMRQCRTAYGYRNSYVTPMRGWSQSWDAGLSRSDRPIYRRDTQVRPYTQLVKVEEEKSDPLITISETLGALNTVGNYIVNMTRGVEISNYPPKELPSALYTISKNILGIPVDRNTLP